MQDQASNLWTKRNLISLLVFGILILGLPLAVNLVKTQQELRSRASAEPVIVRSQDGSPLSKGADNVYISSSLEVQLGLSDPFTTTTTQPTPTPVPTTTTQPTPTPVPTTTTQPTPTPTPPSACFYSQFTTPALSASCASCLARTHADIISGGRQNDPNLRSCSNNEILAYWCNRSGVNDCNSAKRNECSNECRL